MGKQFTTLFSSVIMTGFVIAGLVAAFLKPQATASLVGSATPFIWNIQLVDAAGGGESSLILDDAESPHISYCANGDLIYAQWTGSAWITQTVDTTTETLEPSLALDNYGNPHISYQDYTNKILKYAHWAGSDWDIQIVDSFGDVGFIFTSMALDSVGNPHISYRDTTHDDLKYAYWTGSAWISETVDSAGAVGEFTSLALDSADNPHISYQGGTGSSLKYAYWTGSAWNIQNVDTGGAYTSLALDSAGNPHISYLGTGLNYAYSTSSDWDIQIVDDYGVYTSLALDSSGNPHILYSYNDDLKYAVGSPANFDYLPMVVNEYNPSSIPTPTPTPTPTATPPPGPEPGNWHGNTLYSGCISFNVSTSRSSISNLVAYLYNPSTHDNVRCSWLGSFDIVSHQFDTGPTSLASPCRVEGGFITEQQVDGTWYFRVNDVWEESGSWTGNPSSTVCP